MRAKSLALAFAFVVSVALAVPQAKADTFDFSTPSGVLGTSQSYTSGTLTITAYGFMLPGGTGCSANSLTNCATYLYGKNQGGGESGVGIAYDPLHEDEISSADFVSLDMSNLADNNIFSGDLMIGSVQAGESFEVCIGSDLSSLNNCTSPIVGDGSNGGIVSVPINWTSDNYVVGITGVQMDVLVADGFQTVPEPGSLMLFGTGLLGMAGFLRRKMFKL
jgi:hypothetical protein